MVDEFVGALPPAAVERWLDGLAPSEAERLVESGGEADLRRALELEPGRADAAVALAQLLADRGEREEALGVLANVAGSFAAEGLAARLRLEADEPLRDAFAALDAGETERGLDLLIEAIAAADPDTREDLRQAIVGVLDELGVEHPLARDSRRRLASALVLASESAVRSRARAARRAPPAPAGGRAPRRRSPPAARRAAVPAAAARTRAAARSQSP